MMYVLVIVLMVINENDQRISPVFLSDSGWQQVLFSPVLPRNDSSQTRVPVAEAEKGKTQSGYVSVSGRGTDTQPRPYLSKKKKGSIKSLSVCYGNTFMHVLHYGIISLTM